MLSKDDDMHVCC